MRFLLPLLCLAGATTFAFPFDGGPDRWSVPIDEETMATTFGSDIDSTTDTADICASVNLPGPGSQTVADCVSGPTFPFGPCIDCGTQSVVVFASEVNSGMTTGPQVSCAINAVQQGECNRDDDNNYFCQNPAPTGVNCAGNANLIAAQAVSITVP
jgi:hypothetical protein